MTQLRAAEVARHRLHVASRRLGTQDPSAFIGGLLDRTFELPVGDPRYGNNALLPGCMPIETSFSEASKDALRLDMEPLGPLASPHGRIHEVSRETRRLVAQQYGQAALRWFDERTEPFRGSRLHGGARFGAWFGAAFDREGVQEAKIYYELSPGGLDDLPPTVRHVCRVAQACVPRLIPIFTSVSCNRAQGNQRVYFYHQGELRLLDLEPLMNQLGIGHQLPSLLTARFLSGLSVGLLTATATAYLMELHLAGRPAAGRRRADLVATAANIGGIGLGPLIAGLLAEYAPRPLTVATVPTRGPGAPPRRGPGPAAWVGAWYRKRHPTERRIGRRGLGTWAVPKTRPMSLSR